MLAHEYNQLSANQKSQYLEKARKYNQKESLQGFSNDDLLLQNSRRLESSILKKLGVLSTRAGIEFFLVTCSRSYGNPFLPHAEYASGMLFYAWMSIYALLKISFGWLDLV